MKRKSILKSLICIIIICSGVSVCQAATKSDSLKRVEIKRYLPLLKENSYFTKVMNDIGSSSEKSSNSYVELLDDVRVVLDLQEKLVWITPSNVREAFEDFKDVKGYDVSKYSAMLTELESAYKVGCSSIYNNNSAAIANADLIISLASKILKSNPALDFDKIIVAKYKLGDNARRVMAASLGTEPSNWTNQMSARKTGFDAEITEVTSLRAQHKFRTIFKPKDDAPLNHFQLHWDADRMMYTSVDERGLWNMYEVPLDGSAPRIVVDNDDKDLEFIDGSYLPDGRILTITNLGYQGVPCVNGTDAVGNMSLYTPSTKNLRRLTFDQDANWNPVIMNNGRIMYVRWEYTDLTHYFSRIVMHANPDGTETKALYGSGSFFPNSIFDIRPIEGKTSQFIGIVSGHHGVVRSGRLMLFDPQKGRTSVDGIVQEFPFSDRAVIPIIKDELVNGVWPQFIKPYPINEKYYLVSAKLSPSSLWGIYLVDIYDNMIPILESEGEGFTSPTVVKKRVTPPIIPDKVDLTKKDATMFIQDIYEGEGLPNVPRGTVKKLRIFAYEYAYIQSRSNHDAQGIQSGWDIKRILGEVDVEEDGSAIFKVPANTPISIQPLDSEGRAIQWMRSWTTAMPGEFVSCVGCHEDQNSIVPAKMVMASKKSPSELTAPDNGVRPFVFALEIQPILNRNCISCHDGKNGKSDMSGVMKSTNNHKERNLYSNGYLAIHPFISRQGPEADALVMKPYEYHASTSELVKILKNDHYGVELTDKEWSTLYEWIDLNAPFHGSFVATEYRGHNQIDRRRELAIKYNNFEVNWEKEITDYTALLASKGDIEPKKHSYNKPNFKAVKNKNWPFSQEVAKAEQSELGDDVKEIEIAEGVVIKFRRIPAGRFVMGSNRVGGSAAPEHKAKVSKSFWIGEIEVTQGQFNTVFPKHDNRYIAQFWKDHTTPGYTANTPNHPVIRVSWDEAIAFCDSLSSATGLNITLPTEEQWEWACRAGSNDDFWYGDNFTDFGKFENLADVQLEKMAVTGVDPQPMSKDDYWFELYNFLPKVASVDDGNMIVAHGKSYLPNPWGLYDMHGNVSEWTLSNYVPYNTKKSDINNIKSIKGGHWLSRPRKAGAAYRDGYYQWQKANNVGFRIVINE